MESKENKIYKAMEYVSKIGIMLFAMWCITETINTILIYKQLWPESKWGKAQDMSVGGLITIMFIFLPLLLNLFIYYQTRGFINLDIVLKVFKSTVSAVVILGSIITCAVQWPKTLYIILVFFILFIILHIFRKLQEKDCPQGFIKNENQTKQN